MQYFSYFTEPFYLRDDQFIRSYNISLYFQNLFYWESNFFKNPSFTTIMRLNYMTFLYIYLFFKLWLNVSIIATGNTSVSVPNTIGRYLTLCLRVSEVLYTTVLMLHICVLMQYVHSCPLSVLKTCTDSTNIKSGLLCKMLQTVHTNRRILMRHGVI